MFYHPLTLTEGAHWPFQSSESLLKCEESVKKSVEKVCLTCCYHHPRHNHQPPLHPRIFDSTWKREIHPTYSTLAFITIEDFPSVESFQPKTQHHVTVSSIPFNISGPNPFICYQTESCQLISSRVTSKQKR